MLTQAFKWQNKAFKSHDVQSVCLHFKCKYTAICFYSCFELFFKTVRLYFFSIFGKSIYRFKKAFKGQGPGLLVITKY